MNDTRNVEREQWIAWAQDLVSFGLQDTQQVRKALEDILAERDALAAKVADAGERIAQAIEAHWNRDGNNDAAAQYQAAVDADIARAALTEGTEGE